MKTKDYIDFLVKEIHTVVFATVTSDNKPVTCSIDIMGADEQGLYFLTAKGKNFYRRLKENSAISLTGMKGETTLTSISISIQGRASEIGSEKIEELFEKNPYMKKIYPDKKSREVLTVFCINEGKGEYFDLSQGTVQRASFSFGIHGQDIFKKPYFITDTCIGCGHCLESCPQACIKMHENKAFIHAENCLYCGYCLTLCPVQAIIH